MSAGGWLEKLRGSKPADEKPFRAVDDVSFSLARGEVLAPGRDGEV